VKRNMVIAVASGKGGTGKTTVATNLALSVRENVRLMDCDVEEPNCHIFMKPEIEHAEKVYVTVPVVDLKSCDYCGDCGEFCQFSAIVSLKDSLLTFPELCHSCGGCKLVCPKKAISEVEREIGILENGRSGTIEFVHGRLNVGEAKSPPLIRAVKKTITDDVISIIDAPPGTSCPVIEAVRNSDYVILVTEPTPFGLNDLKLSVGMVRELGIPFGIVINRSTIGNNCVQNYCLMENIDVLLEIPDSRKIAEAYSEGEIAFNSLPEFRSIFEDLYLSIRGKVNN